MGTLSPATADAFKLLRADLYFPLDQAELLACSLDQWSDQETKITRELITDLVQVTRQLLRKHKPKNSGECEACLFTWPCGVLETIHTVVADPERQLAALAQRAVNGDE